MIIKCVIIDDEPLAIRVIEAHLKQFPNMEVAGTFNNPVDALPLLRENEIDVVFIDINMPQMNGMDFIRNTNTAPFFVITTAYREYAVDSYELDVLDYLVKPIPFKRFVKTIDKLTEEIQKKRQTYTPAANQKSHVFLKVDKKMVKIRFDEILYIESLKDYIKVFTEDKYYLVHKPLTTFTDELPGDRFLRIHRSYTIATDKVDVIEGNLVQIGKKRIPIGRKYVEEVKAVILDK